MAWIRIALMALVGWGIFHFAIAPPAQVADTAILEHHPLPATAPLPSLDEPPRQVDIAGTPRRLDVAGTSLALIPRATFELQARVLSSRHYRLGREARISPVDLALGWGPMAEDRVVEAVEISQRNRWYYWRTRAAPIPLQEISRNSSNIHMIAADSLTLGALERLEAGDRVTLRGHLVDVEGEEGWRWKSSTRRTDTGPGACEIMLVASLLVH